MPQALVGEERIHYQRHLGAAGGPQLVLVHGAGGTLMHWPGELRRLPGPTVYALDLPGHGQSGGGGRVSIAEYAAAVHSFAEALQLPPFVLAGHSMGGAIALELALRWPGHLAGLILVGTGARLRVAPEILAGLLTDYQRTSDIIARWAYRDGVDQATLMEGARILRHVPASVTYRDYAACDAFDRRQDVPRIGLPALIVCGSADRMTPPRFSQWLEEQLPRSQLVLIPEAGHMVMLEAQSKPRVVDAVRDFLKAGQFCAKHADQEGMSGR
jgi:pimeloyl-ACP methyl ester carboxylesterase